MGSLYKNRGAVLKAVGDLRIEELPVPKAGPGEVIVAIGVVGICGSDIHYYTKGKAGNFIIDMPLVVGHEPAGIISSVGEGVTHLQVGDKVTLEPGKPCFACVQCLNGTYNMCLSMKACRVPPIYGAMCQFFKHSANLCHKIPDEMTMEEGALMEPVAVAVHACRRGGVSFGNKVLICGSGAIGLLNLLVAKAAGAIVTVTDISTSRLEKAKELGADLVYHVTTKDGKESAGDIVKLAGSHDVTIECTGVESSITTGLWVLKPGGVYVQVGIGSPSINFPITAVLVNELKVIGSLRYANDYPTAIALVSSGRIDVKPLITHRFDLDSVVEAFETAKAGSGIKVLVNCGSYGCN